MNKFKALRMIFGTHKNSGKMKLENCLLHCWNIDENQLGLVSKYTKI